MIFERRVWVIGNIFAGLLVLLSLRMVYWQLVRGRALQPVVLEPDIAAAEYARLSGNPTPESGSAGQAGLEDLPKPVIQRTIRYLNNITRGAIYDRQGQLLAYDRIDETGVRSRFYNEPSLAHLLGYVSGIRVGVAGLERTYNDSLLGLDRPDTQLSAMIHQPIHGSDLILTIDTQIQRAAEQALENRSGAIVVMDGKTGAVLALASYPTFDPNRVNEEGYLAALSQQCQADPSCQAPFLNRAAQALYTPGSTWKTVTLIAALDSGQVTPKTVFDFGKPERDQNGRPVYVYRVGGGEIPDPNHSESKLDLPMSYAKSANAAFARIGDEMSPQTFIDYAARLGFGTGEDAPFDLEIPFSPSRLANDVDSLYSNDLLRAATAIGQGELAATPLNMGMVVLAVLNDGDLPVPYFVHSIRTPSGSVFRNRPFHQTLPNVMKQQTAREVKDMMVTVVQKGYGERAAVSGLKVGGKTGTAQVGGDRLPHAWFIGFAEKGERSVVISIVLENSGEGSQVAAPVFASLARFIFEQEGDVLQEEQIQPTPVATLEPTPTAVPTLEPTPVPETAQSSVLSPDLQWGEVKFDLTVEGRGGCVPASTGLVGSGIFRWPSDFHKISGDTFKPRHPGIDLAAPSGSAVLASDSGQIIYSGWANTGYGNAIVIDHGNGYQTLYGHLSQLSAACGTNVEAGTVIGLSGSTGNSSGPHLHFEVRVPDGFVDPIRVLPAE